MTPTVRPGGDFTEYLDGVEVQFHQEGNPPHTFDPQVDILVDGEEYRVGIGRWGVTGSNKADLPAGPRLTIKGGGEPPHFATDPKRSEFELTVPGVEGDLVYTLLYEEGSFEMSYETATKWEATYLVMGISKANAAG